MKRLAPHMRRSFRALVLLFVFPVAAVTAQRIEPVQYRVMIAGGIAVGAPRRFFREASSLSLEFGVGNRSDKPVSLDVAGLRRGLQFRIHGAGTTLDIAWPVEVRIDGPDARTQLVRDGEPIVLWPGQHVAFPLVATPVGGSFGPGEYRIRYRVSDFRATLSSDGRPWAGPAMGDNAVGEDWYEAVAVIQAPQNAVEAAIMHEEDSKAALKRPFVG